MDGKQKCTQKLVNILNVSKFLNRRKTVVEYYCSNNPHCQFIQQMKTGTEHHLHQSHRESANVSAFIRMQQWRHVIYI